jgi:ubiquinone/menaquinone biosynthesis C-methylase UbiE
MAACLADLEPRATVVDLGCGPGVSTFELERHLASTRIVGLDVAPRMLHQARQRERGCKITWLRADAARLPFADASVDACTGHSFLYLLRDREATLAEVRRVLRPGGRLVLMEPHARGVTVEQTTRVSRDPRHLVSVSLWRPFSRLHGRYTPASLARTLQSAGFADCHAEETLGGLGVLAWASAPPQR